MTTTTAPRNGAGVALGDAADATPAEGRNKTLNIHERKLAVMARVDEIRHDKTHPAHKYTYNSIDNISTAIRKLFVEYGIAYNPSCTSDAATMVVELVNVDAPDDKIVSSWPVIQDDKGYAYSTKFPLVRMFLIADGGATDPARSGENDESEMAGKPPVQPRTNGQPKPAPEQAVKGEPCPQCFDQGIKSRKGETPHFWTKGGRTSCNGFEDGAFVNHKPLVVAGDVDPDTIPF